MTRAFDLTLHYPPSDDVPEIPSAEDIRQWLLLALSRSRYDHPEAVVVEQVEEEGDS